MFKRSFALLLVLVLVIGAFAGCAQQGEPENTEEPSQEEPKEEVQEPTTEEEMVLNWDLGADPKTLDPGLNSANDGGHIINNTFEGLMREVKGKLVPATAESYEVSEDGLTYTFKIREDAKWSDGKPVTAHDFEFAWKRALKPEVASEYGFQLFYIKGAQDFYEGKEGATIDDVAIKTLDDKTLQVELVAPTPYFLNLTSFYTYMPVREDVVDNDGVWAKDPEKAISNGPFKLAEYTSADKVVLVKNEHYWDAENVKLDKIIGTMIVDQSTRLTAFEAGEIDAADEPPVQEIPRLLAEEPSFQILPLLGTYYYIFNVDKEPTNDVRVRKALAYAIDRKAITEQITKGGQKPATGYVPEGLYLSDGRQFREVAGDYGIDPNQAMVEEAKELLAEAGYPNGEGFPKLTLVYNTNDNHKAVAEAIQEMWKQNLGIEVELTNQEWAVFQDTRHQGNFEIARAGWLADYSDPMTFLDMWTSYSGNNDAQWRWKESEAFPHDTILNPSNKEFEELIEKSKLSSGEERDNALLEAEKIMMDEMVVMPIYYYTDPTYVKTYVKEWEKTPLGHWYFGNAYIEK